MIGQPLDALDTPQLSIDLDTLDAIHARVQAGCAKHKVHLRVHFKSLKCVRLAKYLVGHGVDSFFCAKLNEAEVLAEAGIGGILIANEIVGATSCSRLRDRVDCHCRFGKSRI
jgi:D-serine deaminase-like pyridoxal phosphate-dependent protein